MSDQNENNIEKYYPNELVKDVEIFRQKLCERMAETQKKLEGLNIEMKGEPFRLSGTALQTNSSATTSEYEALDTHPEIVHQEETASLSQENVEKLEKDNAILSKDFEALRLEISKIEGENNQLHGEIKACDEKLETQSNELDQLIEQNQQKEHELERAELAGLEEKAELINPLFAIREEKKALLNKATQESEQILADAKSKAASIIEGAKQEQGRQTHPYVKQLMDLREIYESVRNNVSHNREKIREMIEPQGNEN